MRALSVIALIAATGSAAAADPLELGGFFGPRRFADDVVLGSKGEGETYLSSSVVLGPRLSASITSWFTGELELAVSPATTAKYDVSVFWLQPRVLFRVTPFAGHRLRPFIGLGGGMATALSSKRGIYDTSVTGEGFMAAGGVFNPGRGLRLRLDLRIGVLPARASSELPTSFEGEVLLGVSFPLQKDKPKVVDARPVLGPDEVDTDADGYGDAVDQCPARAEDHDGFEDKDGCPDIDNDLDQVLDIVDKCSNVAETYNGFEDDDGCPDLVPPEVDGVIGTIEGLLYGEGDTEVRKSADGGLDKLAAVLKKYPSVRVILIGHTDDREAVPAPVEAAPVLEGEDPPPAPPVSDPADLARELGQSRARGVRDALVKRGLLRGRFVVDSLGAELPVSDNDKPRGRLRNRRVEVKLYVPKRSLQ